jgi:hypothetical protein
MALFDWTSEKQANVYTAKADKKRLAADAAKLIGQNITGRSIVPPTAPPGAKLLRIKGK